MTINNAINNDGKRIVQVVTANQDALITSLAVMPGFTAITSNDYLPQITDGTQILTCSITPKYSTSSIWIEYFGNIARDNSPATMLCQTALFRDANANALAGAVTVLGYYYQPSLCCLDSAGSTATTTYQIRVGPPVSGGSDCCINGKPGYQYMGGTMFCRMIIYEIGV
jgi:hypothetical protein